LIDRKFKRTAFEIF